MGRSTGSCRGEPPGACRRGPGVVWGRFAQVADSVDDPVRDGFVTSFSHPGGNVTGITFFTALLNADLVAHRSAAEFSARLAAGGSFEGRCNPGASRAASSPCPRTKVSAHLKTAYRCSPGAGGARVGPRIPDLSG
jgi:hypothetical protein